MREAVRLVIAELMELKRSPSLPARLATNALPTRDAAQRLPGAPLGTRAPAASSWRFARLRSGSYFPSFLEPRRRSEQALVAVVAEAYVNGVSTRKVERLVAQLGIEA